MTDLGSLKDILTNIVAVLGFVGALFSLAERVKRYRAAGHDRQLGPDGTRDPGTVDEPSELVLPPELFLVIGGGILLNYVGLAVSVQLKSVLYLDMTGTAVSAILLGPWWGAFTGLISNSLVNWLLYAEPHADVAIFPWSPVNMAGALFWGVTARTLVFRHYISSRTARPMAHAWYLLLFGVGGALVTSAVGALVQGSLGELTTLSLDSKVSSSLDRLLTDYRQPLTSLLSGFLDQAWAERFAWFALTWFQHWVRYVPDKMVTSAFAIATVVYVFPLYARELLSIDGRGIRSQSWMAPAAVFLAYVPSSLVLLKNGQFNPQQFWPLWISPLALAAAGIVLAFALPPSSLRREYARRSELYKYAAQTFDSSYFSVVRLLPIAILGASAIVVLALPLVTNGFTEYYRVILNFFCVVYGFLLGMRLMNTALWQNVFLLMRDESAGSRADETSLQLNRDVA